MFLTVLHTSTFVVFLSFDHRQIVKVLAYGAHSSVLGMLGIYSSQWHAGNPQIPNE